MRPRHCLSLEIKIPEEESSSVPLWTTTKALISERHLQDYLGQYQGSWDEQDRSKQRRQKGYYMQYRI